MKSLFAIITALMTTAAWGQTKQLQCTSGQPYQTFNATLDYSGFVAGSGYFSALKASFYDNFVSAQLICVGNTLENLSCAGYLFNSPGNISEVTLVKQNGKFAAMHRQVSGNDFSHQARPWPCLLK